MALPQNRHAEASGQRRLRRTLGARFARFAGAAVAALTATEIALTLCSGVFHLTATPTALVSWLAGAVVSYALSRWAWNRKGRPDVLTDEPGGYQGFNALFGGVNVQPAVSPRGPVKDIDGNVIADASGNPGFPNSFDPSASQTLGYLATMLEAGIPVVYGYIEDMHDNHASTGTFGPGEAGYVAQLAAANEAFAKFFARLAQDGITKDNTLFVVTADENDHFVGGAPSPANCDGVHVACTYQQIGEIDAHLSRLLATQASNTTPFSVHSDSAPTFYINGNPGQTDPITRQLERDVGALTAVNPITGNTDKIAQAMADQTEQRFLHMVTSDPNRTPNFVVFANDNYFNFASGTDSCYEAPA